MSEPLRFPARKPLLATAGLILAIGIPGVALAPAQDGASEPTLEETRVTMGKWIETQQLIGRERNDWNQSREVLKGRIELVGKEVAALSDSIKESETAVAESARKMQELTAERDQLKTAATQLVTAVTAMESEVKRLSKSIPAPVLAKLAPLFARIPEDAATTRVSVAERFQNVLGILNEINKANSEITVNYEVRTMPDGSSSEVQVIYVGLAQAYFVSPRGQAGIGRPTADGWTWTPAPEAADRILTALEIIQGKHSPAFVPLPVNIQ